MRTIKLLLFALFLFAGTAAAQVSYIDADGTIAYADDVTVIDDTNYNTAGSTLTGTTENPGWYLFTDSWSRTGSIFIQGTVNIILEDGCDVEVDGGSDWSGGSITITGGTVTAYSSLSGAGYGAGIGCGELGGGGNINITGGTVTAYSSLNGTGRGAGIGGGHNGIGGIVTGGTINIDYNNAVNASVTAKGAVAFGANPNPQGIGWWKNNEDAVDYTRGSYTGSWTVRYLSLKAGNPIPDESEWTGAQDNNWANAGNWNPGVPGAITTATIPGDLTNYPVLKAEDGATVDQLIMGFGAELGNQHWLTYNTAQVQYDFTSEGIERSRYHFITAPLQDMVSGDVFFGGKPEVWLRYAQAVPDRADGNIHESSFVTLDMTLDVAHNVVDLPAGFGWAYKVDPPVYGNNLRDFNHILSLPKFEDEKDGMGYNQHEVWEADENKSHFYYYYIGFPDARINNPAYHDVKVRAKYKDTDDYLGSRFITEAFGDEMPLHGTNGTNPVLMGNPYLAHLDFAAFSEANSNIQPYFQYYDGMGMRAVYVGGDGSITSTGTLGYPEDNGLIRPLTAVFVTPKAGIKNVTINPTMTITGGGWGLRSDTRAQNIAPLRVNLEYAGYTSTVVVLYGGNDGAGVTKIFSDQSIPELYIRQGEQAKAIATFDGSTRRVPLGIRNPSEGMNITLSGVEAFEAAGISVSLHETNGEYYIVFSPGSETDIADVGAEYFPPVRATRTADGISINGLIPGETFSIVNMQGQTVYRGTADTGVFNTPLQHPGAYIIVAGDRTAKYKQ